MAGGVHVCVARSTVTLPTLPAKGFLWEESLRMWEGGEPPDMRSLLLAAVVGVLQESPGEVEGVHTGVGG